MTETKVVDQSIAAISPLLLSAFDALKRHNILWCVLRDADQINQIASSGGEVDLLVQADQFNQVVSLLGQFGFVYQHDWGHAPHHFFFAYDRGKDCWLKLDVVTGIAYGKASHALATTMAGNCLSNRQRFGEIFIPAPEDEFMTLLLHCVLDKGFFRLNRRERLAALCREIQDDSYLTGMLKKYWSPVMTWRQMRSMIENEQWEVLINERGKVAAYLSGRDRLGTLRRKTQNRVLRKLNIWRKTFHPPFPMVALLAPDGAGKSTLLSTIQNTFYFPVYAVYMGLYQNGKARTKPSHLPGHGFTRRLFTQWRRYWVARFHQARGKLVIFDRYTYDSLLPSQRPKTRGQRWRRWVLAHACPAPDLIIMLDAPGEVLFSRKREHSPDILEQQRQAYLDLQTLFPQMVIVDATCDPEIVRRKVTSLIWSAYLGK